MNHAMRKRAKEAASEMAQGQVIQPRDTEKRVLEPMLDRVLIQIDPPKALESGLVLPETVANGLLTTYTVLSVGPGRLMLDGKQVPVAVKPGDRVLAIPPIGPDGRPAPSSAWVNMPPSVGERQVSLVAEDCILCRVHEPAPVLQ